jgi:hypothetical protein
MYFQLIDYDEDFKAKVLGTKVKYQKGNKQYVSYVMSTERNCFWAGKTPQGPRECKVMWFEVVEYEPHIEALLNPEDKQIILDTLDNNTSIFESIKLEE